MGKIKQGVLGGFSGTVGTVVGSIWNGICYMRGVAKSYKDKKSAKQVAQRTRFKACVKLAKSVISKLIRPIWNLSAEEMTGYNLFMKTNQSCFGPDGAIADFENLKFSVGNLLLPGNIVVQNDGTTAGAVRITWQDNSGIENADANDRLRVVYIAGGIVEVMEGLVFTRSEELATIQLTGLSGQTVHFYVFFGDEESETFSESFHAMVAIPVVPNN